MITVLVETLRCICVCVRARARVCVYEREREREKIVPMDKMLRFTNTIIIIMIRDSCIAESCAFCHSWCFTSTETVCLIKDRRDMG